MSTDRPAMLLDYRGDVERTQATTILLDHLSEVWPEFQPVVHRQYGTYGVVRDDDPVNVPYTFDGKPRRVCFDFAGETWVSVAWNPAGAVPLRAWVPARLVATTGRRW